MMKQPDKIMLYGLRFYGYHGVYPIEREQGQWFELDIEIWGDFSRAANSDNIEDALDYSKIYEAIKVIVEGLPVNLLEHLAKKVISKILEFPNIEKTTVRIKKPDVCLGGLVSFAAVESTGYNKNDK